MFPCEGERSLCLHRTTKNTEKNEEAYLFPNGIRKEDPFLRATKDSTQFSQYGHDDRPGLAFPYIFP